MSNQVKNQSKLSRCIKAPIRILSRAREFYIQSVSDCAGRFNYGDVMGMGCPLGQVSTLPKSFSINSSRSSDDEGLKDLIRAASQRGLRDKVDAEIRQQQQKQRQSSVVPNGLPRSFTVGIGRIDEEKTCDFEEDFKVNPNLLYPRSRSYAVSKKTGL